MKRTLSTIAIVCLSILMLTGCNFGNPNDDKTPRKADFVVQNETIGDKEQLTLYITDFEPGHNYEVYVDDKKVDNKTYLPAVVVDTGLVATKGTHKVEILDRDGYGSIGKAEYTVADTIGIQAYAEYNPTSSPVPQIKLAAASSSTRSLTTADSFKWVVNGNEIADNHGSITVPDSAYDVPEITVSLTVKREGMDDVTVERKFAFSLLPFNHQLNIDDSGNHSILTQSAWKDVEVNDFDAELYGDDFIRDTSYSNRMPLEINSSRVNDAIVYVKVLKKSTLFPGEKLSGFYPLPVKK